MILVTNSEGATPQERLGAYRQKDRVEKVYDTLKNGLSEKRLRTHSAEAMHGKMFVTFISLILQTDLTNKLYGSKLSKKYTVPEALLELSKIRLFKRSVSSQPSFLSEISKKQRDLF